MRSLERGRQYESLDAVVARIAYAYGFTNTPVAIPKKYVNTDSDDERDASLSTALLKTAGNLKNAEGVIESPVSLWGSSKGPKKTSLLSFAILATKHPIAHAIVVKAVLAIAERIGFTDLSVSVSSVGDAESKKRFTRELTVFFKKNNETLPQEVRHSAITDPEKAYRALLLSEDPILERAPRRIDYLSESSRKAMLETLSLFESVEIPYTLESTLPAQENVHAELLFAVYGTDQKGNRVRIASGGRFDEFLKESGASTETGVSMSLSVSERVDVSPVHEEPTCFVVHVGDIAKLRAFSVLEELWKSNLLVGQALMADTLRKQMDGARDVGAKTVAIIGQREALDNTVIVRSLVTQIQTTIPFEKLVSHVNRKR